MTLFSIHSVIMAVISRSHPSKESQNMKAELQEVMNKLRRLQGAIDFSNAPAAERDELAEDVAKIMDELFDLMKSLPDN
jgi:nitrate/TMAO reductase-like tetraheme cytochrome c subunit